MTHGLLFELPLARNGYYLMSRKSYEEYSKGATGFGFFGIRQRQAFEQAIQDSSVTDKNEFVLIEKRA